MINDKINKRLQSALIKKALGYDSSETVEEYAKDGEEFTLIKRKVTTKNVPPDILAVKALLEDFAQTDHAKSLDQLSDNQLETEKNRLMALLKEKTKIETE